MSLLPLTFFVSLCPFSLFSTLTLLKSPSASLQVPLIVMGVLSVGCGSSDGVVMLTVGQRTKFTVIVSVLVRFPLSEMVTVIGLFPPFNGTEKEKVSLPLLTLFVSLCPFALFSTLTLLKSPSASLHVPSIVMGVLSVVCGLSDGVVMLTVGLCGTVISTITS